MKYDDLQREHKEWLAREYPDQPLEIPATGLLEEAGELVHALLKLQQDVIWGTTPESWKHRYELEDAIGDCALYVCSFCNAAGWTFSELIDAAKADAVGRVDKLARSLVYAAVVFGDPPYSKQHLVHYIDLLKTIAWKSEIDFQGALEVTWMTVSKRRRLGIRNPETVTLCGSTRFKDSFIRANFEETMVGRIVLSVGCFAGSGDTLTAEEKLALDELHFCKIDKSSQILVIDDLLPYCVQCERWMHDCGCGHASQLRPYIGMSTQNEIAYASRTGKKIRYRSKELCV